MHLSFLSTSKSGFFCYVIGLSIEEEPIPDDTTLFLFRKRCGMKDLKDYSIE